MNEKQKLKKAVGDFSKLMAKKLCLKSEHGYKGWNKPENKKIIEDLIFSTMTRQLRDGGQEIDIANYAMMLYFLNNPPIKVLKPKPPMTCGVEIKDGVTYHFTTGHKDALKLDVGARRYAVVEQNGEPAEIQRELLDFSTQTDTEK